MRPLVRPQSLGDRPRNRQGHPRDVPTTKKVAVGRQRPGLQPVGSVPGGLFRRRKFPVSSGRRYNRAMSDVLAPPSPTAAAASKSTYFFEEGSGEMRELLGGKGAGLAEMTRAGLPVPPGFIITTEQCLKYYRGRPALPRRLGGRDSRRDARARAPYRQGLRRARPTRCWFRYAAARASRCPG